MPTCHETFEAARSERAKYPLNHGQYKLDEAKETLKSLTTFLEKVSERVRLSGRFAPNESLGPCMASERATYLKNIPNQLAQLIGYNILPAIAALASDGFPKTEVKRMLHSAETEAKRLIVECEELRLELRGGIKPEYMAMKEKQSRLISLVRQVDVLFLGRAPME